MAGSYWQPVPLTDYGSVCRQSWSQYLYCYAELAASCINVLHYCLPSSGFYGAGKDNMGRHTDNPSVGLILLQRLPVSFADTQTCATCMRSGRSIALYKLTCWLLPSDLVGIDDLKGDEMWSKCGNYCMKVFTECNIPHVPNMLKEVSNLLWSPTLVA